MTREELINQLPSPWRDIIKVGTIDYYSDEGRDHDFAKKSGLTIEICQDCSYHCSEIP